MYERTIRTAAECSGIGLHSGAAVHLRILPAPPGTGIVFRRTDLDDFEVEAVCRNVAKVSYATSLMKKGVLISTTEHLLSAFVGMGVDNAIVELDNLELPILDGSALPFVEMITQVGLRQQRRKRVYLKILRPTRCARATSSSASTRRALLGLLHHQLSASADRPGALPGRAVERQLCARDRLGAHLRFLAEAEAMRTWADSRRLARERHRAHPRRHGESAAALCDEFVRHKVLDLIGDLALIGQQILGLREG